MPRFLSELAQRFPSRHGDALLVLALAELLRRDRVALRLLLDALDLPDAPEDLRARTVHARVRLPGEHGTMVDLRVQIGVGEEAWVAHLAALRGDRVAGRVVDRLLGWRGSDQPAHAGALVPRARLPTVHAAVETLMAERGHLGVGEPRVAAWEDLVEALRQDAARMDDRDVPRMRLDFIDLATRAGLGGLRAVSTAELRQARRAATRLADAERLLRRSVRGLLPVGVARPVDAATADALDEPRQARWDAGEPLDVSWSSDASIQPGVPIKGLGLRVRRGSGPGRPVLRWWLRARPRKRWRRQLDPDLPRLGWVREDRGWWAVELVDVGDPEEPWTAQLLRVLRQARAALAADLGLTAGDHPVDLGAADPSAPAGPDLQDIAAGLARLGTTALALAGWRDELHRAVVDGLRVRLGHDTVRSPRDAARRHWLALPDGSEVLLETGWSLDAHPTVQLRLAPGDLPDLAPALALLAPGRWPGGVQLAPDGAAVAWSIDPGAVAVADAVPALAEAFVDTWTRGYEAGGGRR